MKQVSFGAVHSVLPKHNYRVTFHVASVLVGWFAIAPTQRITAQGYDAHEAVAKMNIQDGFQVDLIAAEPLVRQPVAIDIDDRGRLWVLQYLQYPNPAGLKRVKVDRYSRTKYDRVPQPPPFGPRGADRLTILTDADHDGVCDTATDFVDGLNLATGFAFGHGGVFVLQVPYLLFYPDRNRDDVPDGKPEVLLKGFGMEDSSSLANSLTWGPDGWLYGTQGTNITANIRGIEFEQGVWRYHPGSDRFELFCEGGGNSWGLDFDEHGNLLYATNYGGFLMHHGMQGSYHEKSFAKHGELHNRFAFGYFPHVPHDKFEGGHVTVGGFFYNGDSFPDAYRGRYVSVDTLGHAVRINDIHVDGATFRTTTGGPLVEANDTWFAPSDCMMGPDGAVYFCDWHDRRTAHPDPDATWDRSNGRIYRLCYGSATPQEHVDPNDRTSLQLLDWLSSRNAWKARRARRVIAERQDRSIVPSLERMLQESNFVVARQAFWTLASLGAYHEDVPSELLTHQDDVIRAWAIRFIGDRHSSNSKAAVSVAVSLADKIHQLARNDDSPLVISQLAATAQRLPARAALKIVDAISERDEFLEDRYIPLLVWWALERHAMAAKSQVLASFTREGAWQSKFATKVLLGRLMKRFAGDGSSEALIACAKLLQSAPGESERRMLLAELDAGLKLVGVTRLPGLPLGSAFADIAVVKQDEPPHAPSLGYVPAELADELHRLWSQNRDDPLLVRVLMRFGSPSAADQALAVSRDAKADRQLRLLMLENLSVLGEASIVHPLLKMLTADIDQSIQLAVLGVLRRFSDPRITEQLLLIYPKLDDSMRAHVRVVLLARAESTLAFLAQIDNGKISTSDVTVDELRRLALLADSQIDAAVQRHWGSIRAGTPEEKLAEIRRLTNDLRAGPGDISIGRTLFSKLCANCHRLFDNGQAVGPDLTTANRGDRNFLLSSLVDPSAQVRKEFIRYNVLTSDGRVATGLLVEDSDAQIKLLNENNESTTIRHADIDQLEPSKLSLMPEDILKPLQPQQVRDLFAYLQSQILP